MSQISIALLGKTGNGISATGNTILKKMYFRESAAIISCSKLVKDGENMVDDNTVIVYDTPGLFATDTTDELLMKKKAVENCDTLMYASKNIGIHVFVCVLNYKDFFTQENRCMIEIYEAIFGAEFLKSNGILVFTHGDHFYLQESLDFKNWCHWKTGPIKELIDKFEENIILISNKGSFDEIRGQHGSELLNLCLAKKRIQGPYTVNDYNKNESSRRKLLGGSSCSIL